MTDYDDPTGPADDRFRPPDASRDDTAVLEHATDWRDGLAPEEQSFARQFDTPADAVRTALELRRKLSVSLPVPDDGDPEKKMAMFDRLGRPESPDGYEVRLPPSMPDWVEPDDPDLQATHRSFLEAMHGAGATQEMIDAALGWYWGHVADTDAENTRLSDNAFADAEADLRREWGRDFEANVEHANRAVAAFGGSALVDTLDRYGLSNHPAFVTAFARVGRTMGEDDMISGRLSDRSKDQLRQRAEDLVAEDDYWTNEALQREMREIMLTLYGDAEIGPGVD